MTPTPRTLLLCLTVLLLAATPTLAQENRICFACHKKKDLTGEVGGKEVSIFVDRKGYEESVHGTLACAKCHLDVDPDDLPHEEELAPVDCATCHPGEADRQRKSMHGLAAARGDELAPTCVHCHGKHDVRKKTDRNSRTHILKIPILCGECHHEGTDVSLQRDIPQDRILENYSQSIHGEGLYRQGLTVTAVCTSCHTSHFILPHTDERSSIHPKNVADTCAGCHGLIGQVHQKVIEGHDWETKDHRIPACVDCHAPHRPRPDKDKPDDERLPRNPWKTGTGDCLDCHYGPGSDVAGVVDKPAYLRSMHRSVECAQCHTDVTPVTPMTPDRTRACDTSTRKVDCSACHEEALEYATSTHGDLNAKGDPDAPGCLDCHDNHATQSKKLPTSPTFPRNVPDLCARCHREGEKAAVRIHADVADIVGSYTDSIHGRGLVESGLVVTATCSSCHGAHGGLPPDDPRSRVHRDNVVGTCGQCHYGIEEKFKKSVHWVEDGGGEKGLPSCADCHSSHAISRKDRSDFRFRMMDQCGRCHTEEADTFFETIHGKKTALDSAEAAKCYDCHGTHDILPITNPDSALSRRNIVGTCAQCHENAHERFTGYLTHATHHDQDKYPWLYWTFWGMTALLVGTLAFAFLHTGAWLTRLSLTKGEWKHIKPAPGEKLYRRFGKLQRTMHLFMILSFFTLALTGMSLKFSYMGWAQAVSDVLGGDHSMGLLHRMGAITLLVVLCLHIWDVRRKRRQSGRTFRQMIAGPDSILFQWRDLKEFGQSIKWFLGRGPRPHYGRYTYWEKFDYFAVFWGILVIGLTGLMLWFPVLFTRLVPGWFLNVATIIHSDEALLAVGFIFTIHFFNTHFRPDKFPMDPVIFTGRVPVEELKQDKPREYERLVASGELEKHLVDPFPKPAERAAKIFGFVFLGIGLTIIGLIIYSMVFGYR